MLIPRYDARQPDAPRPDRLFLDAVCRHLEPRRLITTEVFLRGPEYKAIWVSVGLNVVAGASVAEVTEEVKRALLDFLSPLPPPGRPSLEDEAALLTTPQYASRQQGWPLRTAVSDRELIAVASRVRGVQFVNDVLLAELDGAETHKVPMAGLQLPRVAGISVVVGDPISVDSLRGQTDEGAGDTGGTGDGTDGGAARLVVPVPVIPEEC
jgi:hypothetical protein